MFLHVGVHVGLPPLQVPWTELYGQSFMEKDAQTAMENPGHKSSRPRIPDSVPPAVTDLIRACWQHNPKARPSMTEVVAYLMQLCHQQVPVSDQAEDMVLDEAVVSHAGSADDAEATDFNGASNAVLRYHTVLEGSEEELPGGLCSIM